VVKTLFSTSNVHPRDRFDYWHDVACRQIVNHDSRPRCRQSFRGQIRSGMLADIGLVLCENSPMACSYAMRHIAHGNTDELFLCQQSVGQFALEQDGRDAVLEPGDIALVDPRRPYSVVFPKPAEFLVLKVPRRPLEARIGSTREITARRMQPSEPRNSLMSALVALLPAHAGRLDPKAQEIVANQVLDLVAISLERQAEGGGPQVSSARSLVRMNLHAAIEARLADPALDASTTAAAAGISVRYANDVLAEDGTSIRRLIQTKRLARCRSALEDPCQAHRTVSEIAYGWGFSDMTHFGRRFREAFGILPSECRKRAI
jgi:AraC family transcriptional regulator, positive regulator of tynA and feaB